MAKLFLVTNTAKQLNREIIHSHLTFISLQLSTTVQVRSLPWYAHLENAMQQLIFKNGSKIFSVPFYFQMNCR